MERVDVVERPQELNRLLVHRVVVPDEQLRGDLQVHSTDSDGSEPFLRHGAGDARSPKRTEDFSVWRMHRPRCRTSGSM